MKEYIIRQCILTKEREVETGTFNHPFTQKKYLKVCVCVCPTLVACAVVLVCSGPR